MWTLKMSREVWTVFLVKKGLQLLGCKTLGFPERRQQRLSLGPKFCNAEANFSHVKRLRNHLVITAKNFRRAEKFVPEMTKNV